ncbi:MAG: cobalamin biosynthesis protein [Chloroflexi bacterium]|nr:cobalamin biosynthesis protein [Chloroflexota bacterium]
MASDVTRDLAVLALAGTFDVALGEPPGFAHPVVWMGKFLQFAERLSPRAGAALQFLYGAALALLLPISFAVAGYFALRDTGLVAYLFVGVWLLKSTFAVRDLALAGSRVRERLEAMDMDGARSALRSLVSRDTVDLTPEQATAAAVESAAENTTDSFVAPWFYFALFGIPGALAYRAINTVDSMVGYHGRYEYLGKAGARLDDLANFIPARVAALLIIAASWTGRLDWRNAWRVMRRDHARTASPNAGWTMSAMAGALDVRLEKPGHYALGDPAQALTPDLISRANQVALLTAVLSFGLTIGILWVRHVVVG